MNKAGLIPYYFDHEQMRFKYLMMISSDPAFGGEKPMISKGGIEIGESEEEGALREAEEELGLIRSNLKSFYFLKKIVERNSSLTFFAGEVISPSNFGPFHYETGSTHWMTLDEFIRDGREDHHHLVSELENLLTT